MRTFGVWLGFLLVVGVGACGGDRPSTEANGETAAVVSGPMEGWHTRADGLAYGGDELEVLREPEGFGFRTTHGGIAFREEDVRTMGSYRLQAAIQQRRAEPGDTRAYGLIIGGGDLLVEGQSYTAFLIRSTGDYTIERTERGATTPLIEWTPVAAIRGVESAGDAPMNILTVQTQGDQVIFLLNHEEVARLPEARVRPLGALGFRVEEGLNLTVLEWSIL